MKRFVFMMLVNRNQSLFILSENKGKEKNNFVGKGWKLDDHTLAEAVAQADVAYGQTLITVLLSARCFAYAFS